MELWGPRLLEEEEELRRNSMRERTRLVWAAVRILRKSWEVQELPSKAQEQEEELPIHRTKILVLLVGPWRVRKEVHRIRKREEPTVSKVATKEVLSRVLHSLASRGESSFLRRDSTAQREAGWALIRRRRVEEKPSSALAREETRLKTPSTCRDRPIA